VSTPKRPRGNPARSQDELEAAALITLVAALGILEPTRQVRVLRDAMKHFGIDTLEKTP
jgi:hypothetical protein